LDGITVDLRITRRAVRSLAATRYLTNASHSFADRGTGLAMRSTGEFRGRGGVNIDRQINPVQSRTADTIVIVFTAAERATALSIRVTQIAAPARIHRGDKLESGGVSYMRRGAGNGGSTGFHRLTKRFQGLSRKFRQLIEKQDASMRERNLTGPRAMAAPG